MLLAGGDAGVFMCLDSLARLHAMLGVRRSFALLGVSTARLHHDVRVLRISAARRRLLAQAQTALGGGRAGEVLPALSVGLRRHTCVVRDLSPCFCRFLRLIRLG